MEQTTFWMMHSMLLIFLGVAAYFDCKSKRIPWSVQGMGVIFTAILFMTEHDRTGASLLLAMVPGVMLILLSWLTRESIGYGDGISVLLLGGMAGFHNCVWTLCISLLLLSLTGLTLLVFKRADRKTKIPYLPFLFAAEGVLTVFHVA